MTKVITALFKNPKDAAAAIRLMEARGVPPTDISLVANESFDKASFGIDTHTKMPEGVALGASGGAAIGALVAGLTSVGAVATGGAGLLAAGPIIAALAGAGAGGVAGGTLGGLIALGVPEHEVKHYEDALNQGAVLIGVSYDEQTEKEAIETALEECNTQSVSSA